MAIYYIIARESEGPLADLSDYPSGARYGDRDGVRVVAAPRFGGQIVGFAHRGRAWADDTVALIWQGDGKVVDVLLHTDDRSQGAAYSPRDILTWDDCADTSPEVQAEWTAHLAAEEVHRCARNAIKAFRAPQIGDHVRYTGRRTKQCEPGATGQVFWIRDGRIGFKPDPSDREAPASWCNVETPSGSLNVEYTEDPLVRLARIYAYQDAQYHVSLLESMRKHAKLEEASLLGLDRVSYADALNECMRMLARYDVTAVPAGFDAVEVDAAELLGLLRRVLR